MDIEALSALSNVHLLGQRPHSSLPRYVAAFDVCLIPYVLSPYTVSVVPTKLFEYLASGEPVVASRLPEVVALALPREAVTIATTAGEFSEGIAAAIRRRPSDLERITRRRIAQRFSWDALLTSMLEDIAEIATLRSGR